MRWSATMTHQGNDISISASGKSVRITGISIVRLANGQNHRGLGQLGSVAMMREIGAIRESNVALIADSA